MKTHRISLDGADYEINIEEAQRLGLIKEIKPKIEVGDIFHYGSEVYGILVQIKQSKDSYTILGCYDNLNVWSGPFPINYEQLIEYIDDKKLVKVGNINETVSNYLENLSKKD